MGARVPPCVVAVAHQVHVVLQATAAM
jgi:hypothetical protein